MRERERERDRDREKRERERDTESRETQGWEEGGVGVSAFKLTLLDITPAVEELT